MGEPVSYRTGWAYLHSRGRKFNMDAAHLSTTELICGVMEDTGTSREKLAAKMGVSLEDMERWLDGWKPVTIHEVANALWCMGHRLILATEGDGDEA